MKTHKSIEVGKRQRALGASGITVSTFAEAEAFAHAGFSDITWALPNPLGHLDRVLRLADETGSEIRLLTDDLQALRVMEERVRRAKRKLHVFLKVDSGYHRAGVDPRSTEALDLVEALDGSSDVVFDGILTHAGHGYHARSKDELRAIAREEREVMIDFAERARKRAAIREISIGSTPTISVVEDLEGITEIRPGNYVFHDFTQVALESCAIEDCALTVLARVISHQPSANHFVTDAGALALSKDTGPDHLPDPDRYGMGHLFEDYATKSLASNVRLAQLSQEHGVVITDRPEHIRGRFKVGDRVRILEHHSCLCAALFDEYCVVRGDEVIDRWRIERRRD
jgi:D-serine deaminase-like pyridoxal phosphate-dependent protein